MNQIDSLPEGQASLNKVVPEVIGKAFTAVAPSLRSMDRYVLQFGVNLVSQISFRVGKVWCKLMKT